MLLNRNSVARSFKRVFIDLMSASGSGTSYLLEVDHMNKALTLRVKLTLRNL